MSDNLVYRTRRIPLLIALQPAAQSVSPMDERIILSLEGDEAEMELPDNTNFRVRQRELCSGNNFPSVLSLNKTQSGVERFLQGITRRATGLCTVDSVIYRYWELFRVALSDESEEKEKEKREKYQQHFSWHFDSHIRPIKASSSQRPIGRK